MSVDAASVKARGIKITRGQVMMALSPLFAIIGTLIVVAIVLVVLGYDPITVYSALLYGAAGSWYNFGITIIRAVPLLFAGLAVAFAYRAGLFNIGAEGQLQFGALAATLVGLFSTGLPGPLRIILAILAGMVAGAIWGGIPGLLKAKRGINEIIVTIMLNYIAILTVLALVERPLKSKTATFPSTDVLPKDVWLPIVLPDTRVHAGFILAIIATIAVYFILRKTTLGFQIRAVGLSPNAARTSGMSVAKYMIIAMLISGALAGLAGASEIMGVQHRLAQSWSAGWGYTAIVVALLGRANPVGVFIAAIFFGALTAGSTNMQAMTGLPGAFVYIVEALPVLFMIAMTSRGYLKDLLSGELTKVTRKKEGVQHGNAERTV